MNEALQAAPTLEAGPLLNEHQAAALLGVKVATLRNWRWMGKGPRYRKLGRCVRYARTDLAAFAEGGTA